MRIELPTKKQLIGVFKYGTLLAMPMLAISAWLVHKDPVRLDAEQYLMQSKNLTEVVGTVKAVSLAKATYVQAATSYSGDRTAPYNLYRYKVRGSKDTVVATVRVEEPGTMNETYAVSYER